MSISAFHCLGPSSSFDSPSAAKTPTDYVLPELDDEIALLVTDSAILAGPFDHEEIQKDVYAGSGVAVPVQPSKPETKRGTDRMQQREKNRLKQAAYRHKMKVCQCGTE
jgi:hypothetical protein